MFKYSLFFLLVLSFTPIRAPDPERTEVKRTDFESWGCDDICNDANKDRVGNFCVKLSGVTDANMVEHIRKYSVCETKDTQLISQSKGAPRYYPKSVGFCQPSFHQEHKCITKSKEKDDLLVWDWEGEGSKKYCAPKYEKTGWFAPGGEF